MRIGAVAATVIVVLAVLGGCTLTYDDGGTSNETPPTAPIVEEDLATDERAAIGAAGGFWLSTFPDEFGRGYQPPIVIGGYIGDDGPTCADQQSVPFNAFYCPSEDFIAWDENLMAAGYEQIGDAWVYLIIAHEWAHAIQARLEQDRLSVAAELQADCLAGAALIGAARSGDLVFEPGDQEELAQTLAAVADEFPWTNERDHGNARERIGAFQTGLQGGVRACTS